MGDVCGKYTYISSSIIIQISMYYYNLPVTKPTQYIMNISTNIH